MKISFRPEFRKLPTNSESQIHVITEILESQSGQSSLRPPISVALVIDRSGSMEGEKMAHTKAAVVEVINTLTRRDRLALVTFESQVEVIVPLTYLTNKPMIIEKVASFEPGGTTNLSGGWFQGLEELKSQFLPDHQTRLIILTDGQANQGITEKSKLIEIARKSLEMNIATSTFGFGSDFNEELLSDIAKEGGGRFYYLRNPEDIASALRFEFGEIATVVGQNLKIIVTPAPNVKIIDDLTPIPSTFDGNVISYSAGDLLDEVPHTLIFRLLIGSNFSEGEHPLFTVDASYISTAREFPTIRNQAVCQLPFGEINSEIVIDNQVLDEVIIAKTNAIKKLVLSEVEKGNFEDAVQLILDRQKVINDRLQSGKAVNVETLKAELDTLNSLKLRLKKSCPDFGKELRAQIQDYAAKKGTYLKERHERKFVINRNFIASDRKTFEETFAELDQRMLDLGMDTEFALRVKCCLLELVGNAIEHGCKGNPNGVIEIKGVFRRGSVRVSITDPGNGFDTESALEKARNMLQGSISKFEIAERTANLISSNQNTTEKVGRGRGLAIVLALADELQYNDKGYSVMLRLVNRAPEGVFSYDMTSAGRKPAGDNVPISVKIRNHISGADNVCEIAFEGGLDLWTSPQVEQTIQRVLNSGINKVAFDLKELKYCDSTGFAFLLGIIDKINERGGKVACTKPNQYLSKVMEMIGLSICVEIVPTIEEAIKYLHSLQLDESFY